MRVDFDSVMNFLGYLYLGIGATMRVFFAVACIYFLVGYGLLFLDIHIFAKHNFFWTLPAYIVIAAVYSAILYSILYRFRLNGSLSNKVVILLNAVSFPLSALIVADYCSENLCYI